MHPFCSQIVPHRVLNVFTESSQPVPGEFPTRSWRVPNAFPMCSHCDQKTSPHALFNAHYVSARALATFRGGDICLVLVYKATFPMLFGPPVSSSVPASQLDKPGNNSMCRLYSPNSSAAWHHSYYNCAISFEKLSFGIRLPRAL
jgi:hypothetical protein